MLRLQTIQSIRAISGKESQTAVCDGRISFTWARFEDWTRSLVAHFATKGYGRVAFLSANRPDLFPMMSAFSTLGVSFVGIDYTSNYQQIRHCVHEIGANCIVHSEMLRETAEAIAADFGIDALSIDSAMVQAQNKPLHDPFVRPRPFESISFTSGTTGLPKAVQRAASFDTRRFADLKSRFGFGEHDVFIATIPFFHASVNGWARLFLALGASVIITDVTDPVRIHADIVDHAVTTMLVTPSALETLLDVASRSGVPSTLRCVVVGGKYFPPDLKRHALSILGPIVNEYYGTTETGVNAMANAEDMRTFPESVGRVMDGSEIIVVDAEGRILPEGRVGRVAIDSYQRMDSYLTGSKEDFLHFNDRRYFVTADYGYLCGDRLFLTSRSFGVPTQVNLYAMENALREIPGVRDVFSVVSRAGVLELYVAKDGVVGESTVYEKAYSMLGGQTDLRLHVEFVVGIPYSMSGKVRVSELP